MVDAVKCKLLLYADDSALKILHSDVNIIQERLSMELKAVNEWLVDKKLSLHLGKTESILLAQNVNMQDTQSWSSSVETI